MQAGTSWPAGGSAVRVGSSGCSGLQIASDTSRHDVLLAAPRLGGHVAACQAHLRHHRHPERSVCPKALLPMTGWRLSLLVLFSLVSVLRSQPATPTQWVDVCEAEDYIKYRDELCPKTFFVSTIAFDPLEPKQEAFVTLILQPSDDLFSNLQDGIQLVNIEMPGFEPYSQAPIDGQNQFYRQLEVYGQNPAVVGQDPSVGYNTFENPLFESPAFWDTRAPGTLRLAVKAGNSIFIKEKVDTEIRICCLVMPVSSPKDTTLYQISGPTSQVGVGNVKISAEPVMRSPFLDPGFQFDFLQIYFNPPDSKALAVISLTIRSATDLGNRNRIILHLPSITREPPVSGVVEFNTAASADPNDWMLFAHEALWDNDRHTITFFLRAGATLTAGKQVTLRTNPGEYRLPVDIEADWDSLQVEARSFDDIDMIIRPTPVSQASRVPHVRNFTISQLKYSNNQPYGMSNVEFTFMTNRPMFVGTVIYLRLAGFQAQVVDVVLLGKTGTHFQDSRARFHLPDNIIELRVNKTFYSNEENFTVVMADLFLPAATYENDAALMVKNSDAVSEWHSIEISPPIGPGTKEFIQSQLLFSPMEPRMPANITFIVKPSVIFYQGDKIIFHLYSFLYGGTTVQLLGEKAHYIKNSQATWDAHEHMLIFEVADNEIILNTEPFRVTIHMDSNFRLPDKLSQNDGICRIEGISATGASFIAREPMKKTPKIGEDKFIIESRIEFEPIPGGVLSDSVARIRFKLILNTDVLPNSTIYIKLGAVTRDVPQGQQSATVRLSGANAPLFVGGVGDWNADTNFLTIKIVPNVQIYSGERITFFLERDELFKLPVAMYPRDPSFRIKIPEAGISERPFNFSTRVSQDIKTFTESEIYYGTSRASVAFPNTVVDMTLRFMANVNIPGGSRIRITLPGYTYPSDKVLIRSPETLVQNELHLTDVVNHALWNQLTYEMDVVIPMGGNEIPRQRLAVAKIMMADGGFRLPSTSLAPNDLRLTIAIVENQIIYPEPIKISPRVVARSFARSEFQYLPPVPESIFQLKITIQPTVEIPKEKPIIIALFGFNNSFRQPPATASCIKVWQWDCPTSIHILGESRGLFENSMAWWNQSTNELLLEVVTGVPIVPFTVVDIFVAENQGFTLPESLNENDTRITIRSVDNIIAEPVKSSPMIGDGPKRGHLFCMMQYERGVRTDYAMRMCDVLPACLDPNPPLEDPCSHAELVTRCGCDPLSDEPVNFTIHGFQLQESDTLQFLPWDTLCGAESSGAAMSAFSPPQKVYLSEDKVKLSFENISSIDSGYFRICMMHMGSVYQVGKVVVRPSCQTPLVLVDGVCVHNCPKTKIPVAGNCVRDPNAVLPEERQALMLPIRIDDVTQIRDITFAASDDAERTYFEYRFRYDLSSLLNCDSSRILISSLSSGQVEFNAYYPIIINTIFTPAVGPDEPVTTTSERSPLGLVTLLKALQTDMSSAMYMAGSTFFYMNRSYQGTPIKVRKCEDNNYRVFCPFDDETMMHWGESALWYWLGTVVIALIMILLCCGVWYVDYDRQEPIDEDLIDRLQKDPKQISQPEIRLEFARSWLEGRFMGERWQKARDAKLLPIGPG